jgi:GH3 auxin-responsive promoter
MVKAALANAAWLAAGAPAWSAFVRGLADPAREQEAILRRYLRRAGDTAFGREHGFSQIADYDGFQRRVPIRNYDEFLPWIARIRRGEQRVLTADPVRRLVPTSGSTAARKLIPYTDESHREFNRAIGPWIADLFGRTPGAMAGPAYWSITPAMPGRPDDAESAVPIGFAEDSEYLGRWSKRLVDAALAAPGEIHGIGSMAALRYVTLLMLLRRSDLALISVWHPSFLELLLDALAVDQARLAEDVAHGGCAVMEEVPEGLRRFMVGRPDPGRAEHIATASGQIAKLWPRLAVVSCWADGPAASGAEALAARLPGVIIQPKGLLATEGIISLAFRGQHPLAIRSHFFEFLDAEDRPHLAGDLSVGETYRVLLTTAGGLWRYRLDDLVQVDGTVGPTPSIRFVGKAGLISDRAGEKLSDGFVAGVFSRLFGNSPPRFALLAADGDGGAWGYTLFLSGDAAGDCRVKLDELLAENPHYAYCRRLGQLRPPRIFQITGDAYSSYCARLQEHGQRVGDIKPAALSVLAGWSDYFPGRFVTGEAERATCSVAAAWKCKPAF